MVLAVAQTLTQNRSVTVAAVPGVSEELQMEKELKPAEPKTKANTSLGWGFWVMVIIGGLIGKLFGLIGGAAFLAVWWLFDYLRKKKQ